MGDLPSPRLRRAGALLSSEALAEEGSSRLASGLAALPPKSEVIFARTLSASVPVHGPFRGDMKNSGGGLTLFRPTPADTEAGDFSFVRVDHVTYSDSAPWPAAADGGGASLQRKERLLFGDDAANWVAALPSPTQNLGSNAVPSIASQPTGQTVVGGARVVLSIDPSPGGGSALYQWRRDGLNVPSGTNIQLVLDPVDVRDAG